MPKLARRLVEPDHLTGPTWIETYGPEVAELNASVGFTPDAQQELCLDIIFGIGEDGLSSCFEFGCVVCRQNLKTGLFKQVALGWIFTLEVPWFVWSAHEMSTTREAQNELHSLIADSHLSRYLPTTRNRGKYDLNGGERIELVNDQRILFKARTISGGRGLAAPKVILDEAFALKPSHVGSLIPTLGAQADPQVLYGSSAGKVDSPILRDLRDRGRSGASDRLAYVEWLAPREACADPECRHPKDAEKRGLDCALDRRHLWRKANPTISTGRIRLQTIADFRQALPPEEFTRECLGWWDEVEQATEQVLPGWNGAGDLDLIIDRPQAIGLAVSFDRQYGSIGAAARLEDGRVAIGAVKREPGSWWLVDEALRMQREYGCLVAIDGGGPASSLIPLLEQAGVTLTIANLSDMCDAYAGLYDSIGRKETVHPHADELDDAVAVTVKRIVVDRATIGRRASTDDISMLEAAMISRWAATTQEPIEVSIFGFGSLEMCDRCGANPHDDPEGEHDYLCMTCREEHADV